MSLHHWLISLELLDVDCHARVIIYCRRCEECAELYHFFHSSLKQEFTEPVGAPNLAMFCLVDMYIGVTRKSIRDSIVTSFGTSHAPLRVVICTIAFGMVLFMW